MKSNVRLLCGIVLSGLLSAVTTAFPQGTAFTYQGRLNDGANAANGSYDFRFCLASDLDGNNLVGSASVITNVLVTNGLFTATMDFGAGIFTGSSYWLQVEVRTNGVSGYTQLLPLQALTPTPYSIFSATASNISGTLSAAQLSGQLPSANLSGTYGNAVAFNNAINSFNGTFNGSGSGLNTLNAASLSSGTVPDARLSSNVPLLNANQTFGGVNNLNNAGNSFSGNGAGLTTLNASSLASGTVPDGRLSVNVAQLSANQTFTGANSLNNAGNSFTGNGAGLIALNASSLANGTLSDARLSWNVAQLNANQTFSGANTFNATLFAGDVKVANGTQYVLSSLETSGLRIVRGAINPYGTNNYGVGFTVGVNSNGSYKVTFTPSFTEVPIFLTGGPYASVAGWTITWLNAQTNSVVVESWFNSLKNGNVSIPFIAIGGR